MPDSERTYVDDREGSRIRAGKEREGEKKGGPRHHHDGGDGKDVENDLLSLL
jgi:hypothetical protein